MPHPDKDLWRCDVAPAATLTACRLPKPTATIRPPLTTTGITPQQFAAAARLAIRPWNATRRVKLTVHESANDAEIRQEYGPIDRQGAVLAWSTLPCSGLPIRQRYDAREQWDLSDGKSDDAPSLWLVIAHELGHALGLDHYAPGNIMAPYYSQMSTTPGPEDLAELERRYNEQEPQPMPTNLIRLFLCILNGLPAIMDCIAKGEAHAHANGEASPLMQAADELRAQRAALRAALWNNPNTDPTQSDAEHQ
jgi:hypothetical protein